MIARTSATFLQGNSPLGRRESGGVVILLPCL
jgi:hypothetical protein